MKSVLLTTIISLLSILAFPTSSLAEPIGSVTDPVPKLQTSPLIISAYYFNDFQPGFVQVHNSTNELIQLDGWTLQLLADPEESQDDAVSGLELIITELTGYMKPRGHIVIANQGLIKSSDIDFAFPEDITNNLRLLPKQSLVLVPPEGSLIEPHNRSVLPFTEPSWVQWGRSTSSTSAYLSSYDIIPLHSGPISLEGHGGYEPVQDLAGLQIVEILANARSCAPQEQSDDCGDYIKLYNSTSQPIDLNQYRLRTDSGGQTSSATNTFGLSGELPAYSLITITKRDNGNLMSLTNSGGYVWLEDTYGVVSYAEVAEYPDASSSHKGQSWAYDEVNNEWRWMQPRPNLANYWAPTIPVTHPELKSNKLADCGPGRERNPATNRCRLVAASLSTYTACPTGQERNPDTNRCRSVLSATTMLKPCAANQYRNPETNRCKAITTASTALGPCPTGQERNPDTNRCRKVAVANASTMPTIKDVEAAPAESMRGWYVAGAAVIGMVAYGVYEWRRDILGKLRSVSWPTKK